MLTRVSGIGVAAPTSAPSTMLAVIPPETFGANYANAVTTAVNIPTDLQDNDFDADPDTVEQIKMLLYYGIIDVNSNIYPDVYVNTLASLDTADAATLQDAYTHFVGNVNAVGDIFGSIWNSVKQIGLAPARGAYLALVSLNCFGMATQLNALVTNPDGSKYQPGIDTLEGTWHKKLMGDTNLLLRAIANGAKKAKLFGVNSMGDATSTGNTAATLAKPCASLVALGTAIDPALGTFIGSACVIIAALLPIILAGLALLSKSTGKTVDPSLTNVNLPAAGGTSTLSTYLPYIVIGGIAYLILKR